MNTPTEIVRAQVAYLTNPAIYHFAEPEDKKRIAALAAVLEMAERYERLERALESLQSDAQCTIDLYNKIGPTWTSRDSGAEYYDASYVIGSAEERIATIKAALADTKGTT